jgi:hypothetical protein
MNEANAGSRKKSASPYKAVKVYPTNQGSQYAPVPTFDPATARGPIDRIERSGEIYATQEAGLPGFSMGAATLPERQAYLDQYMNNSADTILGNGKIDFDVTGGLGSFGGGKGTGPSSSDKLAWAKWRAEQAETAEEKATKQRALGLMQQQLAGGYRGNTDDMLRLIESMGQTAESDIGSAYGSAIKNIGAGYGDASRLMGTGYNALDAYLKQNNSNPYAGLMAQAQGQIPDSMNYLQAYGAPTADVQGQIQAEQLAGQQGGDAFNQLISVLSGAQGQSNLSRLAESQMARNLGTSQLGAQRAGLESQAAGAQAQALSALKQRQYEQQLQQEAQAGTRKQDIIDALIAAGYNPDGGGSGSGSGEGPGGGGTTGTTGTIGTTGAADTAAVVAKKSAVKALAAKTGSLKDKKLVAKINDFVAKNPNASDAKVAKAFPKLSATLKK